MQSTQTPRRIFNPLASRKVRVACATIITAFAAELGLQVSEDLVFTVLGVGVSLILGIALEDAGKAAAAQRPIDSP